MRLTFLLSAIIVFLVSDNTLAQKNEATANKYLPAGINVDGNLTEWGDSLKTYDPATTLRYDVGNDQTNLYLAIQTSDPVSIRKVLTFGFSFSINKEAKKKPGPTVTFPVIDHVAVRSAMPKTKPTGKKEEVIKLNQLIMSKANGIKIERFAQIVDGVISLTNEYGMKGKAVITDSNTLKMELAIPLHLLDIPSDYKEAFTYNFRVNGPQRTVLEQGPMRRMGGYGGYGYGYGGYGYGEREVYKRTISETKEFWAKYILATPPSK
jgi:hypothetical protein